MKLAEIMLKKRKASGICAHDKCKIREGLTAFQHPVGPILLCKAHSGMLDAGEEQYVIPPESQGPAAVKISPDGKWYWDIGQNAWLPYVAPAATAATPAPTPAAAPAPAPIISDDGRWIWDAAQNTWLPHTAPVAAVVQPAPTPDSYLQGIMEKTDARNAAQSAPAAPAATAEIIVATPSEFASRTKAAEELLALANALPVERNEDVEMCVKILKDLKVRMTWVEEAADVVMKPIREEEARAKAMIAAYEKPLAAIDDVIRQKVANYANALTQVRKELAAGVAAGTATQAQLAQTAMPSFDGLSLSDVWDVEVTDLEAVTPIYIHKELNKKLVLEHARMSEKMNTKLEIPGLKLFKKKRVSVTKPKKKDAAA